MGNNLVGQRAGRLVVLLPAAWKTSNYTILIAQCDCGKVAFVRADNFQNGRSRSCGCGRGNTTHGHTAGSKPTPEYESYRGAKQRCNNPNNPAYADYGGRGIQFRFNSFMEWWAVLGPRPEPKEFYSVDRINDDGNYEPGNVRWATDEQQRLNQRAHRMWQTRRENNRLRVAALKAAARA